FGLRGLGDRRRSMGAWWKDALCRGSFTILGWALLSLWITRAEAEEDPIDVERSIADTIQSMRVKQRAEAEEKAKRGEAPSEPAGGGQEEQPAPTPTETPSEAAGGGQERQPPPTPAADTSAARHWAVLPEIGYSPEKGANGGIKFTDRDVTSFHL